MSRPTLLKFYLDANDDDELTCFFCGGKKCELIFTVRTGQTTIRGVHTECAEKQQTMQSPSSQA